MVKMTRVISDAYNQLCQHMGLANVKISEVTNEATTFEITVKVDLPSRAKSKGISITGVYSEENCLLVFGKDYPVRSPIVLLRKDFPLNLPHINPYQPEGFVLPCLVEGSLDEAFHQGGLDHIIDQLILWLHKAASNTLIDANQGWEPTRRDSSPSTIIFSAEEVQKNIPIDGSILSAPTQYIAMPVGIVGSLYPSIQNNDDLVFNQKQFSSNGEIQQGNTLTFFTCAAQKNSEFQVYSQYEPETVFDYDSLLKKAESFGIDRNALDKKIQDFYLRSILQNPSNPASWKYGVCAIVVLGVYRPQPLIGSGGRNMELLPYVVHFTFSVDKPLEKKITVEPAFHAHDLSPQLLALTSGYEKNDLSQQIVMFGCGSLGSKIALHLGRAGFGNMSFVDNEFIYPHNLARHALIDPLSGWFNPYKVSLMRTAFTTLSHIKAKDFVEDGVEVMLNPEKFKEVIPDTAALIVDTTASLKVLTSETVSTALNASNVRLSRAMMFGQGNAAIVLLEGVNRSSRVDDLTAYLFDSCRFHPHLREAIANDGNDLSRVFTGVNCSSITSQMSDAVISRSAAITAMQIQKWLTEGFPKNGCLAYGVADGLSMLWRTNELGNTTVLNVTEDDGWEIRILDHVAAAIYADVQQWGKNETGGALVGKISFQTRTILIAGLVDAPVDSIRQPTKFILGIEGLQENLLLANQNSLSYLQFIGTWHSHPMGGAHSQIDRNTLKNIAEFSGGLPCVSLVWTPDGLICAVSK